MATGRKSNLSTIAKKGNTARKPASKKPTAKAKPAVEVDDKDAKTKQKVEELLKDLPTGPKDDLLEFEEPEADKGSMEWLEEQVGVLTARNEELELKAAQAETNYKKMYSDYQKLKEGNPAVSASDGEVKKNVYVLFNEVQSHYQKTGQNFRLAPVAFLNRMIMYFPFLKGQMKF